jgi:bifunctional UDP-N-acetylglucosamine pyrophosphorylase/glucosamine-1-phosphate N-acetyltransferase
MIKKVVISAAGQGTRMQELSENKSKHLIEVNSRPFLAYLLDNIIKAGYSEIMLVVGFRQDLVAEFLKTYALPEGVTIGMVNQFEILGPKEKMYGTACPLMCVKDFVGGDQFISLVGDNFYSVDDLKSMNIDDDFCYVGGLKNDHPEKFGVLLTEGDPSFDKSSEGEEFLKEIVEKPKEFVGDLINTSLYKFTPEVFEKLSLVSKSPRGEYEITDVISLLARDKKVKVKTIKDNWMDFGRPEDVKTFETHFLKNG